MFWCKRRFYKRKSWQAGIPCVSSFLSTAAWESEQSNDEDDIKKKKNDFCPVTESDYKDKWRCLSWQHVLHRTWLTLNAWWRCLMAAQSESLGSADMDTHWFEIILQNTGVITGIYPHQKRSRLRPCTGQQQRFQEDSDDTQGQRAQATSSS